MAAIKRNWIDKLITISPDFAKRLADAKKTTGRTETDIFRAGAVKEVEMIEAEMQARKKAKEDAKRSRDTGRLLNSEPSAGLGLTRPAPSVPEAPPVAPAPVPQVVVMQQAPQPQAAPAAASITGDAIEYLATWITAASDYFEIVKRQQTAADIIKSSTENEADREQIAKALDAAVELRKRSAVSKKTSPLEWIKRVVGA